MNKPSKFTVKIPMPSKFRYAWQRVIERMKPGQSFVVVANRNRQRALYNAAAKVNVKIVTERHGTRIRVWRAQ